ncbi:MAG TPA: Sir2 family NAD-dependent protein deacetylase [Anaeromyxobacteraceae bacterium]|nr:Sir2 family NAD-dependent protein deacetylase [Anaeromyxobacteraceae bacterium]
MALTGAGVSTGAGIPDFRGPNGLYVTRRYDPELVFSIDHFRKDPRMFYEFTRDFMGTLQKVKPTFTHRFLARLEGLGMLKGVVTQNIDALHRYAGSRRVVEIHGSYWSATCISCRGAAAQAKSYEWWEESIRKSPRSPVLCCGTCGGVIKPDVVFFGEAVRGFEEAVQMVEGCDLLLVLGSSLAVYPAASLPQLTRAAVVLVNKGGVALAPAANRFFVEARLDDYFSQVAERLGIAIETA